MIKNTFLLYSLVLCNLVFSQNIEIGQNAEDVKTIVEWKTNKNQKKNRFKKSKESELSYDLIYEDGILIEIILCHKNDFLIDFEIKTDYCDRLVMKNGKLNYMIKEFKSLSLDKAKEYYIKEQYAKIKIDEFYFTNDFEHYYKFYLSNDKLASVECRKTSLSTFSKEMNNKIKTTKDKIEKHPSDESYKKEISKMRNDLLKSKDEPQHGRDSIFAMPNNMKQIYGNNSTTDVLKNKRKALSKPNPRYVCNEKGIVVVEIKVNRAGDVIDAIAGINGTTNNAKCLLDEAKKAAMGSKWEKNENASEIEMGRIVYTFSFN